MGNKPLEIDSDMIFFCSVSQLIGIFLGAFPYYRKGEGWYGFVLLQDAQGRDQRMDSLVGMQLPCIEDFYRVVSRKILLWGELPEGDSLVDDLGILDCNPFFEKVAFYHVAYAGGIAEQEAFEGNPGVYEGIEKPMGELFWRKAEAVVQKAGNVLVVEGIDNRDTGLFTHSCSRGCEPEQAPDKDDIRLHCFDTPDGNLFVMSGRFDPVLSLITSLLGEGLEQMQASLDGFFTGVALMVGSQNMNLMATFLEMFHYLAAQDLISAKNIGWV